MKNLMFSKVSMSITALALLAVFGLTGCGGGGGGGSSPEGASTDAVLASSYNLTGVTANGVTLGGNLIAPVTVGSHTYYYWDASGDGTSGGVDNVTHDLLDQIFNGGTDTTDTTSTNTVTLSNGVTIHLLTQAELVALYNAKGTPAGWSGLSYGVYWTATQAAPGVHNYMVLYTGLVSMLNDTSPFCVAFEVLSGSATDTTAPTVASTSPVNNATGFAVNTAITATFSEPMTASTINTSTFTVNGVTGTVTYSGTTATFTPSANLAYYTAHIATITTGVKDAAGNAMASNYTWSFTTASTSVDVTAPSSTTATNFINSGASSTSSTSVTLAISATDAVGVAAYYVSEVSTTPSTSAAGWMSVTSTTSYSANVSFILSSGDGTKTVYVWFKDAAGNVSVSANDSINLSTVIVTGWSSGLPMPTARYWAASAVVGNDIYVIGGAISGSTDAVEKYNTLTNSWTSLPAMPFQAFLLRGATVGGKIYIFGGSSTQLVYRYDPASGTWTKLTDMPYLNWMGAPAVVNNKVYIFGGYSSSGTAMNTSLEYDPSTDTWTTKATMPTARYAPATAVYNNMIYVLGGNYGVNKNEVYDPATNTWQTKAAVPFTNYGWGVAGALNGNIYFVDSGTSNMAVYFPLTDNWTSVSGLSTPRQYLTGEIVNGKLYVIGGNDSSSVKTNIVDIYAPSATLAPALKSPAFQNMEVQTDYSAYYDLKHQADEDAIKLMLPVR